MTSYFTSIYPFPYFSLVLVRLHSASLQCFACIVPARSRPAHAHGSLEADRFGVQISSNRRYVDSKTIPRSLDLWWSFQLNLWFTILPRERNIPWPWRQTRASRLMRSMAWGSRHTMSGSTGSVTIILGNHRDKYLILHFPGVPLQPKTGEKRR